MNILIIGSKGFIGGNLRNYLIKKNYNVWSADVIVDYVISENYFLIDISNSDYKSIFEKQQFDICINCSGAASVPDSIINPFRDYSLNTGNVFKILDAIRTYQSKCKFINLSSAAVYGNPTHIPISEECSLVPLSPYGFHKLQSEQICREFYKFFNIGTCSLRIFSAFGKGLKKQLFWDLYKKTNTKSKIKLFGTGRESRDFIYIDDLVYAIELVSKKAYFKGESINIANGEEIRIENAVSVFYSFFNNKIDYSFSGEERKGDPSNWLADISRLKEMGYKSTIGIELGLSRYYNWIKKYNE